MIGSIVRFARNAENEQVREWRLINEKLAATTTKNGS
jgi:hypothetical protein